MIDTGYTTLDQRPKAFYAVGVDTPTSIDFGAMLNAKVLVAKPSHSVIAGELIGVEGGILGDISAHEMSHERS